MTVLEIAELLGGPRVLGRSIDSDLELDGIVEEGLPSRSVESLMRHMEIGTAEMATLIPKRTLIANKQRARLSADQSDRVARLARVFRLAEETLGSAQKARVWILRPNRTLGGRAPLELVRRSSGSLLVERALGRLAHGVYT
ncbi:MAG TPA: antitoxin Xre/MbcA/ParS toxin-binding domain-containing protein [Longimicrobium sp.]|jgi:putative toxin-antitoxin system antitoxin component (TIGR02293 family)